jgi:hypothetical protein
MKKARTLQELFSFNGFKAKRQLEGKFGEPKLRIVQLERKKKRQAVPNATLPFVPFMIEKLAWCVTVMRKVIKYIIAMKGEGCIVKNATGSAWKP